MVYQVLARVSAQAAWEPYEAMTREPLQAMALVRKAQKTFADVTVIQADTAALLREQVARLRAEEPTGQEACPLPSLTATPRISMLGATIESQRWAIEQGPGGDHDTPYRFEAPNSAQTLARWARLMGAAHDDGVETETLAELANDAEGAAAPESDTAPIAPATTRSERVS